MENRTNGLFRLLLERGIIAPPEYQCPEYDIIRQYMVEKRTDDYILFRQITER